MISQQFMNLLDEVQNYTLTDYLTLDQCLLRLKEDWEILEMSWCNKEDGIVKDTLFNIARRGFELCSLMDEKHDVYHFIELARQTHIDKNAGYSGDDPDPWKNFRQVNKFNITATVGCLTRLCDKYSRLFTLLENPDNERVGEKIEDTLIDLSNYCLILMCLLEE